MTLLILCDEYVESITPISPGGYEPAIGTGIQPDVSFLWGLVPDDLHTLSSEDTAAVEACWKALVQYASDALVKTAHLDQTRSLLDFPLNYPVRWMPLEISRSFDLERDTETLVDLGDGQSGEAILYATNAEERLGIRLPAGAQRAGAVVPLRSRLRGDTCLRWAWSGQISQAVPGGGEAWVLLGWGALDAAFVHDRSGLFIAMSTSGRLGVLHVGKGSGLAASSIASAAEHSFYPLTITADPSDVSISAWWQAAFSSLGDVTVCEITLQSGEDLETLTVPLTQVVSGQNKLNAWEANFFGMWGVSRQALRFVPELRGEGVALLKPSHIFFSDLSLSSQVRKIPVLFPAVHTSEGALRVGIDYEVEHAEGISYLRARDQLDDFLWAESAALDLQLLRSIFGPLLPVMDLLDAQDTERLRHQIVGGIYGLLRGPHPAALSVAAGCLLGAPVALGNGEVISLVSPLGEYSITVQEVGRVRTYLLPPGLSPVVAVGDQVTLMQPLTEMPEVLDWVSAPARASDRFGELQKFSSLLLDVPLSFQTALVDLFYSAPPSVLEPTIEVFLNRRISGILGRYLKHALAVWVGSLRVALNLVANLDEEDLVLGDELGLSSRRDDPDYQGYDYDEFPRDRTTISLDMGLNDFTPRLYNVSDDVYGEGERDPCADHSIPVYNEQERKILLDTVEVDFNYTGVDSGTLTVTVYGESVLISHGGSYTFVSRDDWDLCPVELIKQLDFSVPANSGYLAGLL